LRLDKTPAFAKELAGYRKQLAQSYLKDTRVTKKLLEEAFERSSRDVRVAHILIKVAEKATARDRKEALKRIKELRKQVMESFRKIHRQRKMRVILASFRYSELFTILRPWLSTRQLVKYRSR